MNCARAHECRPYRVFSSFALTCRVIVLETMSSVV